MSETRDLYSGLIRLHVLHHACEQPIFGLWMIDELARHGYKLSPGTLYPILHHLEESGYVSCKDAVVSGKRRKNYRTTRKGRKLLSDAQGKLRELFSEVVEDHDRRRE